MYANLWLSALESAVSVLKQKTAGCVQWRLQTMLREPRWCSESRLFVYNNFPSFDAVVRKLVYFFGALYATLIICWFKLCYSLIFLLFISFAKVA